MYADLAASPGGGVSSCGSCRVEAVVGCLGPVRGSGGHLGVFVLLLA